jgi:hypothetical protein
MKAVALLLAGMLALAAVATAHPASPTASCPDAGAPSCAGAVDAFLAGRLDLATRLAQDAAARNEDGCSELETKLRAYWMAHLGVETGTSVEGDAQALEALAAEISPGRPSPLTQAAAGKAMAMVEGAALGRTLHLDPGDENLFWVMVHSAPRDPTPVISPAPFASVDHALRLANPFLGRGDLAHALIVARGCASKDDGCAELAKSLERYRDILLATGSTLADAQPLLDRLQTLDQEIGNESGLGNPSIITRRVAYALHQRTCVAQAELGRSADSGVVLSKVSSLRMPADFCARVWQVAFPGMPVPVLVAKPKVQP